ncbi:TPA: hypothetical protein EYN98_24130 [Candidatus Poribacteria bacterium]|nr:hypothetical protein [Candidatus Poribacteria bacterium]HIO50033.1 hypothetical protein [Candidatus Poribacteria bacterium]HIO79518.1 hypothetical protein [Candidatus Poribacteria bacterium]
MSWRLLCHAIMIQLYYLNRVDPHLDQLVFPHPFLSQRQVRPGTDASEREIRRATAAYYGMVETIDSHYREVLDALMHVGKIWTSGLLSIPLIMAKCWENMAFGKNKSFSKRVSVFR